MGRTLTERLTATAEDMRLYQQERAILEATELLCQLMQEQGVNRSELAQRLGTTKGYVTQLLDGRTNMTVRTMSDVFTVLGRALHFRSGSLAATTSDVPIVEFPSDAFAWQQGPSWQLKDARWPRRFQCSPERQAG